MYFLKDSEIVNACYNVHEPYIPLMANAHDDQFKLYINDTGLLCAMYGFETKLAVLLNFNVKCPNKHLFFMYAFYSCIL